MPTALAKMPQRASNSFTLAFGVLNIPLSVYTGTEETRVARKEFFLTTEGEYVPVGRSAVRQDTGEIISSADVVRMATATSGAKVAFNDDDMADATSTEKGVGDIVTFVSLKNVGEYLAENQVQVRPTATKGKSNAAADKAFALLMATMKKKKVAALVQVALRGPARFGLLHSDGTFVFVRTADQIREARPMPEDVSFSDAEMDLAAMLIDAVGIDTPVITDQTAVAIQAAVDAKAEGIDAPVPAAAAAPVTVDIMAQLQASIEANKKGKAA